MSAALMSSAVASSEAASLVFLLCVRVLIRFRATSRRCRPATTRRSQLLDLLLALQVPAPTRHRRPRLRHHARDLGLLLGGRQLQPRAALVRGLPRAHTAVPRPQLAREKAKAKATTAGGSEEEEKAAAGASARNRGGTAKEQRGERRGSTVRARVYAYLVERRHLLSAMLRRGRRTRRATAAQQQRCQREQAARRHGAVHQPGRGHVGRGAARATAAMRERRNRESTATG